MPQKLEVGVDKIAVARRLPLPADISVNVDSQEWVHDRAEWLVVPMGINHERIAEMEDRLLAQPEFAYRRAISGLAALAERCDAAFIILAKYTVIDDQEPWPAEKWVCCSRPARKRVKPESAGLRVVSVLE